MEGGSGGFKVGAASPGGADVGEGDDVEVVGADPQRPCPAEAFQVSAAAGVGPYDDHLAVHQVDGVEGLAVRGRDPGSCGGEYGTPGCLQGDGGAGVAEELREVLPHGGGGDPHDGASCRRPQARRRDEREEDWQRTAVL